MKKSIFMVFLFGLIIITFLEAKTFYVSPNGSGTACTETNPCSFSGALSQARNNGEDDTIYLLKGIYTVQSTYIYIPSSAEHNSLTISGAPATSREEVILDGQSNRRILWITDNQDYGYISEVILKGFTVRNGRPYIGAGSGGGIFIHLFNYNVTISNIIAHNNQAENYGGGIYVGSTHNVTIENCLIFNNHVIQEGGESRGGGIATSTAYGNCTLRNNVIFGNIATSDNVTSQGGGIFLGSHPTYGNMINLINNTIFNNQADQGGGAEIYFLTLQTFIIISYGIILQMQV